MSEYCSCCQNIENKHCCLLGIFEHLENWVLVFKRHKEVAKRRFVNNKIVNNFLEAVNVEPLFGSASNLARLCLTTF